MTQETSLLERMCHYARPIAIAGAVTVVSFLAGCLGKSSAPHSPFKDGYFGYEGRVWTVHRPDKVTWEDQIHVKGYKEGIKEPGIQIKVDPSHEVTYRGPRKPTHLEGYNPYLYIRGKPLLDADNTPIPDVGEGRFTALFFHDKEMYSIQLRGEITVKQQPQMWDNIKGEYVPAPEGAKTGYTKSMVIKEKPIDPSTRFEFMGYTDGDTSVGQHMLTNRPVVSFLGCAWGSLAECMENCAGKDLFNTHHSQTGTPLKKSVEDAAQRMAVYGDNALAFADRVLTHAEKAVGSRCR